MFSLKAIQLGKIYSSILIKIKYLISFRMTGGWSKEKKHSHFRVYNDKEELFS